MATLISYIFPTKYNWIYYICDIKFLRREHWAFLNGFIAAKLK